MEREVKGEREREARVQGIPEIHFVSGLPQEQSILHVPDSDRKRLCLENLPGVYNMSCTQLLAMASTIGIGAKSSPSYGANSQISMDFWVKNWKMESNPWILSHGSSLEKNKGIDGETTMGNPQYDVQTFICDLNLTPEEMVSTSLRRSEFSPITLDTPGKKLPKKYQEGSPAGKKEGKRTRDDDKAQLKTPQQIQKRKKIRPKVVRESNTEKATSKPPVKKAKATTTPAAAETSYVRPKRSCRRSLRFDYDVQEEDEYCGLTFTSEGHIGISLGGKIVADTTMHIFGNIPKRKRQSRTRAFPAHSKTGIVPVKRDRKGYRTPQLKVIVSKMQSDVFRKKRSNRDPIASQLNARVLNMQWRRQNSTGTCLDEIWEHRFSPDDITKLFKELDINKESHCLPHNKETALILHKMTFQEQKTVVQYKRDGSIILYPTKKNYQPKVKLDAETTRVWKLLMVSIDSEGIDGSDEDKQKWWEEERKVFCECANSFIVRMRLVQGDRSFSPWKGSVVDSVVGVFLTQNVADHSSSSAFIDIAAEFPINVNSNKRSCLEEWGSSVTHETVMNLDPGNAVATPRIRNPTCIIIHEVDDDDDIDAVCSQETSKTSDFYQGISMVPSTSTCCELNLNEVPFESENCDAFRNKVDEGSQVQPMCSHQQELKSTLQAQDQESNTRTDQHVNSENKPTESFDWDSLRRQAEIGGQKRERTERTMDTVNWDALRCTNVNKIADIIRKRGVHNVLSRRIKAFLNRLVQDHEEIDLEWLRDVPPDKAKEYLLSINGLGLKSVECVRLLSLHQIAFPVDTNVGRIAVRLGWVPLEPLPDELQMHLLQLYPVLESVQKYMWPRLCKLDQKTLYELHYHLITFGKVFCTKSKPNCNACPMKAECRHYASARASARLVLPEPEEETTVIAHERRSDPKPVVVKFRQSLFLSQDEEQEAQRTQNCEPIIEEPATPEPECAVHDIEDYPWDSENETCTIFEGDTSKDPWENGEIPTIMLHKEDGTSKDLVVLSTQAASIPTRKLKLIEKLRTEHFVYELPDSHPILEGFEKRELDDKFPYLLAIWTPGETASSIQPPKRRCLSQESNTLCREKTCFSCNNTREENSQIVRGTILIPCRTAMKGGFPLNGTYFQTNEVFADHGSSINPIDVPRQWIWNLPRRIAYFGSSVTACFAGLTVEAVQYGFWRGYVCVRGFDRKNRTSQTLVKRLHCPPSNKKHS